MEIDEKLIQNSEYQHGVAVAVKAKLLFDRSLIGFKYFLTTGKSAYQNQQRRTRQVKIGDDMVGTLEFKTGPDVEINITSDSFDRAI